MAKILRAEGEAVVCPEFGLGEGDGPRWRWQVGAILAEFPAGWPSPTLIGHSGGGPLLPTIASAIGGADGYIFVDASIPADGASRLDLFEEEVGVAAVSAVRRHLEAGGSYPRWTNEDLRSTVPDARMRAQILAMLRPQGLDYWAEPIPVFEGWPDAPCGYLGLSSGYEVRAEQARRTGWLCLTRDGGHFDLLTRPVEVAGEIREMIGHLRQS